MRLAYILTGAALLVAPDLADARTDQGQMGRRPDDSSAVCMDATADIVMLMQYGGKGLRTPYRMQGSEERPTITTVTGDPGRPVVLLLSAYKPTVWDLSHVSERRIRGVVVSGHYEQAVSGLPEGVPISMRHYRGSGGIYDRKYSACPDTRAAYAGSSVVTAALAVRSSMGRLPSEFFGSYSTPTFDLSGGALHWYDGVPPAASLISENPLVAAGMPGNHRSVSQLVADGTLIPISDSQVDRMMADGAVFMPANRMASLGPRLAGGLLRPAAGPGGTYLVTRTTNALPSDLAGSHLLTFLVPPGIRVPTGGETGSSIYRVAGMAGLLRPSGAAARIWRERDTRQGFMNAAPMHPGEGELLHHAKWRQDGSVIVETPAVNDVDPSHRSSERATIGALQPASLVVPPRSSPYLPMDHPTGAAYVPSRPKTSDTGFLPRLFGSSMLGFLAMAVGVAWGVGEKRRRAQAALADEAAARAAEAASTPVEPAPPTVAPTQPEPASEVQRAMAQVDAQLKQVVEVSDDDTTAVSLMRLRRTIGQALGLDEYDDDIALEMDSIVERHLPEHIRVYVHAYRRTGADHHARLDETLRTAIGRIDARLRELMAEQSARDVEKLTRSGEFIKTRHGTGPDSLDD